MTLITQMFRHYLSQQQLPALIYTGNDVAAWVANGYAFIFSLREILLFSRKPKKIQWTPRNQLIFFFFNKSMKLNMMIFKLS